MKTFKLIPILIIVLITGCEWIDEDPVDNIDQITGIYEVDEWSETLEAQSFFQLSVYRSSIRNKKIYIENFYNAGIEVFAEVNGYKIQIPLQQVGYYEIEGMGSYYEDELTMEYSVTYVDSHTEIVDMCNAICVKF
ncbi:MAG: hypothetical protein ACXAAH_15535 [Promethearchaeota archaeon]|jgi:hypothetical protein